MKLSLSPTIRKCLKYAQSNICFFERDRLLWLKRTRLWNVGRIAYFSLDCVATLMNLFRKKSIDKKTVFVMTHSLDYGGAEKVATLLASGLVDRYHVFIISARGGGHNA